MMKKLLTIFACLVLVVTFSMPVSAVQDVIPDASNYDANHLINAPTSKEVKVQYSVGSETYKVKIPANVVFSENVYEIKKTISVDSAVLAKGRYLNLTVSSKHGWKMHTHTNGIKNNEYFIPYWMTYPEYAWDDGHPSKDPTNNNAVINSNVGTSKVVLLQAHGISELTSITVAFHMSDQDIPSTGVYQDILTFEISVEGTAEKTDPEDSSNQSNT